MKTGCNLLTFVLLMAGYSSGNPVSFYRPYGSHLIFKSESQKSSALCEVCVVLIQKLDFYVQTNETEQMINSTLYGICDHFTGDIQAECVKAIPWIEEQVKGGFDPQAACTKLMLCMDSEHDIQVSGEQKQKVPIEKSKTDNVKDVRVENTPECTLCKFVVSEIDKQLYQEKDVLLVFIENLCHELPTPADKDCLHSVDSQLPILWDDFFKYIVSPDNVCRLLELCTS